MPDTYTFREGYQLHIGSKCNVAPNEKHIQTFVRPIFMHNGLMYNDVLAYERTDVRLSDRDRLGLLIVFFFCLFVCFCVCVCVCVCFFVLFIFGVGLCITHAPTRGKKKTWYKKKHMN